MDWYSQNKNELDMQVDDFLNQKIKKSGVHGIVVPHAGYEFSGKIAGKAFSALKKSVKRAVILGPSHHTSLLGVLTSYKKEAYTPFGSINIFNEGFDEGEIQEHSIDNQVPFLQKLGFKEILPLMIGQISDMQAVRIAEKLSKINKASYIFSTDLSHFLPYEQAIIKDKKTIEIIKNLDLENADKIDACGKFPLLVLINLCKMNNWQPKLIEYKNSGDVTGDKTSVVGYSTFYF